MYIHISKLVYLYIKYDMNFPYLKNLFSKYYTDFIAFEHILRYKSCYRII